MCFQFRKSEMSVLKRKVCALLLFAALDNPSLPPPPPSPDPLRTPPDIKAVAYMAWENLSYFA